MRGSRPSLWPAESPLGRHWFASVTIELSTGILNKFEQAKMAAPRHVLLELDDDDDDRSIASASSAALGIESSATSFSARRDLRAPPPPQRRRPRTLSTRRSARFLQTSKLGAIRTRSSTAN